MAHFERYNTSDSTTGQGPLGAAGSITPIIINTEQEGILTGSMIADQAGNLNVDQSFDYNPLTGTGHWDVTTLIAIAANTGTLIAPSGSFSGIPIIAPYCRIRYTNGATPQTFMRLFVRAFGTKTG